MSEVAKGCKNSEKRDKCEVIIQDILEIIKCFEGHNEKLEIIAVDISRVPNINLEATRLISVVYRQDKAKARILQLESEKSDRNVRIAQLEDNIEQILKMLATHGSGPTHVVREDMPPFSLITTSHHPILSPPPVDDDPTISVDPTLLPSAPPLSQQETSKEIIEHSDDDNNDACDVLDENNTASNVVVAATSNLIGEVPHTHDQATQLKLPPLPLCLS